jgi:hypothetical protein
MTNKAKKSAPVKAGSNIRRSLDAIGADLLKRTDMFESGKLLDEAKRACEHGEFLPWLELYWPYSEDTAERHMAAYHLSTKFRTVRNMKVAPSTIYKLIDLDKKPDPDVPALIEALVEESKTAEKPLTIAAANRVIELATLEIDYGPGLPLATLYALRDVDNTAGGGAWKKKAVAALKKAKPTDDAAAEKIVLDHRPDDKQTDKQADKQADKQREAKNKETDAEQAAAAEAARNDIGANSKSEAERLAARVGELENEKRVAKTKILALESEVEELKAARTLPALTVAENVKALAELLKHKPMRERIQALQSLTKQADIDIGGATARAA